MSDFNQAIILGNLTRDPELRTTPSGRSVATFTLATNRRWTNQDGQQQEETEFHNVVAWGRLAEICAQILYKGRKALICGRLRTRNWEGQDGIKRYTTEIIADQMSALGPSQAGTETESTTIENTKASKKSQTKTKEPVTVPQEDEINLDDIPF